MGCKDLKTRIRSINDTQIQPIIQCNDFLRQNMLNYARNQFSSEAKKLQPANVGPTDFTNIYNMSTAWDYGQTYTNLSLC